MTLGEIGLESMFAVELQQEFEREFNMKIGLNHIKSVHVGMLKEYEAGKLEHIENYLTELKIIMNSLLKYKFIIPIETHSKLNARTNGKPIYLLPPLEITFSGMEGLVAKFDRPVIGLNWTKNMNGIKTMKEITKYYSELLKKLEPNGKYDLIGYLDGGIVISKLLSKGLVNRAVVIDICSGIIIKDDILTDKCIIELLFTFIGQNLPVQYMPSYVEKMIKVVSQVPDLESKIKKISNDLKEFVGRGLNATDLEEIFDILVKISHILFDYRTQKKNKFSNKLKETLGKMWAKKSGKFLLIRSFKFSEVEDVDEEIEKSRDNYFLPQNSV